MTPTEGARIYLDFLERHTKEGMTLLPFPPQQNQEKSELALFGTLFFTLSGPGGLPGKLTAETFTLKEAELKKQPQMKASWSLDALQSSLRALNPLAWAEGDRSVVSSPAYLQAAAAALGLPDGEDSQVSLGNFLQRSLAALPEALFSLQEEAPDCYPLISQTMEKMMNDLLLVPGGATLRTQGAFFSLLIHSARRVLPGAKAQEPAALQRFFDTLKQGAVSQEALSALEAFLKEYDRLFETAAEGENWQQAYAALTVQALAPFGGADEARLEGYLRSFCGELGAVGLSAPSDDRPRQLLTNISSGKIESDQVNSGWLTFFVVTTTIGLIIGILDLLFSFANGGYYTELGTAYLLTALALQGAVLYFIGQRDKRFILAYGALLCLYMVAELITGVLFLPSEMMYTAVRVAWLIFFLHSPKIRKMFSLPDNWGNWF